MQKLQQKPHKMYRIVEHQFKTDVKYGIQTIYFVQELTFWGWKTITEQNYTGMGDYIRSRKEFDTKDDAIAYIKWLRTPLEKDRFTYL